MQYTSTMMFRYAAAALALAATTSKCAAFSTTLSNTHAATKSSKSSLSMGPPIDPSAPAVDLFGEGSRKYRRTVYTHNEWVKHRSSDRFVNNISTLLYSGIYKNVGKEVLATTLVAVFVWTWNLLVGGYEDFSGVMHDPLIQSNFATAIGLPLTIFTTLSPSLGLLLVFRTNSSYNRWDEARKFWGLNINHTRDLNRLATAWYGNDSSPGSLSDPPKETKRVIDPEEREYLLGQVSLFTWAFVRSMKRHLSPPEEDEEDYIAELKTSRLTDEQANAIISATHRPNRALYDLSVAIEKLPMHFMRKNEINKNLSIFEDTLGGCERLLSSPVPLFYSRHTARFISVWLLFLPFALYGQFGESWNHIMMVPATALISLFLFGIEELATQLEEPFTILPMQGFCDKIGMNCEEIVSWAGHDVYKTPEEVMEQVIAVDVEVESSVVDEPPSEVKSPELETDLDVVDAASVDTEQTEIEIETGADSEEQLPSEIASPVMNADSDVVEASIDGGSVDNEAESDVEDEQTDIEVQSEVESVEDVPTEEESGLKMKSDATEISTVEEEDIVEEEQPEIEMASDNEPEVEIEDETPVEVESPKMEEDSVIAQPVNEKVTAEEESPMEPPEVKMEQDFKKTKSFSTVSLRDLVERL